MFGKVNSPGLINLDHSLSSRPWAAGVPHHIFARFDQLTDQKRDKSPGINSSLFPIYCPLFTDWDWVWWTGDLSRV